MPKSRTTTKSSKAPKAGVAKAKTAKSSAMSAKGRTLSRKASASAKTAQTPPRKTTKAAPIASALNVQKFAKGETLFREGDPADRAYVITKGAVTLSRRDRTGDTAAFLTLREGEIVGEMALIVDIRRTATATAREDTELIVLGRTEFDFHLGQLNPFVLQLLRGLVKRLKDTTDAYLEF